MRQIEIGNRIKMRRKELNISAAELAKRLSMSKATIHRYENGDIANIKMPVMYSLAKELRVGVTWLMGNTESKEPIDTEEAMDKYTDLNILFLDLHVFFKYTEQLISHDKVISEEDRLALAEGIDFLRRVILDKYK